MSILKERIEHAKLVKAYNDLINKYNDLVDDYKTLFKDYEDERKFNKKLFTDLESALDFGERVMDKYIECSEQFNNQNLHS